MPMTREEYIELLKHISETGGDTEDMLEALKKLQDDYDEREGMLKKLGEDKDKTVYTDEDVFAPSGKRWSEEYDDVKRRYRERFFSTPEEAKENQEEDIKKDDKSTTISYESLFKTREGDYK